MPAPPTSLRQPPIATPEGLRKTTVSTPRAAAGSPQLSMANWSELYRNRQLRSFHSISPRPHMCAMRPIPVIPAPMAPPAPAERRRMGEMMDWLLFRASALLLSRPTAVPSWKPRLRTWVARIIRARGWSSAYSALGKKCDIVFWK